jgi:hypothetical protein
LKGMGVIQCRWWTAAVLLATGILLGKTAIAQAGPAAQTIQEAPQLENQTLSDVKYDNKYEISGAPAYSHFNGGPSLIGGTNLGGFDVLGTRWMTSRLGVSVNVRGYYGTQAVVPNALNIHGPFIYEHQALGGVSVRGPKNQHAAVNFHLLVGGAYGVFNSALDPGETPQQFGMFGNGFAFASAAGGSVDLNRSPKLALRIQPDYLLTRFGGTEQHEFAISVGVLYRFTKGTKRARQHQH